MDMLPPAEKAPAPVRYAAAAFKCAAALCGILAIPGGITLLIQQEIDQKAALTEIFSNTDNNVRYELEGAHIVVAEYGRARYVFNFLEKNVTGTWSGEDKPGAGLTSFRGIDNPARAEFARKQGCLIAEKVAKATNPGHYTADSFPVKQEQAAAFVRTYCPQIP